MDNSQNQKEAAPSSSNSEGESLEGPVEKPDAAVDATTQTTDGDKNSDKKPPKKKKSGIFKKFSIYLLLFAFIVFIAIMVIAISYFHGHTKTTSKIKSTTLNQGALSQLSSSDVTVGDAKQVLNVQSNAVFAGQVLIRSDLQVAGKIQVGGTLAINGLTVTGSTLTDSLQVNKNLQVAGDTGLQGQLTVQKGLTVTGAGNFSGPVSAPQLATSNLQLNSDLVLTHHITAGGGTPSRSPGSALGGGGSTTVNGSDTAGSINVNTGSAPVAGCMITVTFASKFNNTPHVVVTPIGAAAGGIGYYVTRTTSSFSVCDTTAAPAGQSFGFDYIVFD